MKKSKNYIFSRYSSKVTKVAWTVGAFLFAFSVIAIWLISAPHLYFPAGFSDHENAE